MGTESSDRPVKRLKGIIGARRDGAATTESQAVPLENHENQGNNEEIVIDNIDNNMDNNTDNNTDSNTDNNTDTSTKL